MIIRKDWKFQINSNKIEWVDPKRRNTKIAPFAHHNLSFILNINI